ELDRVKHVILGIGVDVNLTATDFAPDLRKVATSLKIAAGAAVSRPDLATAILREFDTDYAKICDGEFASVADEWEAGCSTIGREIRIRIGDRDIRGRAESLDDDGALRVRTEHGQLE